MSVINESESNGECVIPELIEDIDEDDTGCASETWPSDNNIDYDVMDDDEYMQRLDFKPANINIECKDELKLHLHAALLCKPELLVEEDGINVEKVDSNMKSVTGGIGLEYIGQILGQNTQKIARNKANVLDLPEFSDLVDCRGGTFIVKKPLGRTQELYETIIRAGKHIKQRGETLAETKKKSSEQPEVRLKSKVACNFFIELIDRERQSQKQIKVPWQQVQIRYGKIFDESSEDYDLYLKYTSGINDLNLASLPRTLNTKVIRELTGRSSICKALSMPVFNKLEFEELPEKTGCMIMSIKQDKDENPSYTMKELEDAKMACLTSKHVAGTRAPFGCNKKVVSDLPKQQNIPVISKRQDPKAMFMFAEPPVTQSGSSNKSNDERNDMLNVVVPSNSPSKVSEATKMPLNANPSNIIDSDSTGTETEVSDGGRYSDDDEEEHKEKEQKKAEDKAAKKARKMASQMAKSSMYLNPSLPEGLNSALPPSSKSSSEFENSTAETPIFTTVNPWDQSKTSKTTTNNTSSHTNIGCQVPSFDSGTVNEQSIFTIPPPGIPKYSDKSNHQQPPILPNFSLNANTEFPMSHHYANVMQNPQNLEAFSSSSSNGFKKVQECERALTSSLPIGSGQKYSGPTDDLDRFRSGRGTVNNWNNDSTFPMNAVNVERMSLKKNTIGHRNSYLPSDNSESNGTRGYINRSHPIRNEPSPSNIVIANSRNNQSTQTANILEILEELSREGLIPNKSVSPINPSERGARRVCLDLIRDMVWAHRHSTSPITLKFIVNILPSTMAPETVFETNNWHEVIKKELPEVVLWPFNNTFALSWKENAVDN